MPTKTTATATTTMTNNLLPLGGIKKESLAQAAEVFNQPNTWRPIKFATLQVINNKAPNFGFFLKKDSISSAGWYGLPNGGIEKSIPFGKKNKLEEGILFQKPNMILIDQSPRIVQVTDKGFDAYTEALKEKEAGRPYDASLLRLVKKSALIDIYCDQFENTDDENGEPYSGYLFYKELKDRYGHTDFITMRTMYLIFLLNDQYELLHSTPLVLTIFGLAALEFADAIKQFGKGVLGDVSNFDAKSRKLSNASASINGLREFGFSVQLEGGCAGSRNNFITKIAQQDNGLLVVGGDYIADGSIRQKVADCAEVNDGFAYRFAKQVSTDFDGYNQMSGAVEQALLPSAKLDNITTVTEVLF